MSIDLNRRTPSASIATLAAAVGTLATIFGGGTATLLYLAGIQGDVRVLQSQVGMLGIQITRLESRLDRGPAKAP